MTALTERNSGKGKMELPSRLGLSMMCSLHLTRVVSQRMVLSAKKGEVDSHSTSVCHDKSHTHGDLTSLAPHERLPEILVVPREKTPTGANPTLR